MKNLNSNMISAMSFGTMFAKHADAPEKEGAQWLQLERLIACLEPVARGKSTKQNDQKIKNLAKQLPIELAIEPQKSKKASKYNRISISVLDPESNTYVAPIMVHR